jgi:hypothetical protein
MALGVVLGFAAIIVGDFDQGPSLFLWIAALSVELVAAILAPWRRRRSDSLESVRATKRE